jgi:spermidine synthase
MIGGAGYSYPKDYLKKFPDARLDVIEIDPMLTELAKRYFNLKDDKRLVIYHEDGRTFLNRTKKKYDVIFGDAFTSYYALPYQLTTRETVQKMYEMLNDDGVILINIISSIEGEKGKFLRAEYATFKTVFPQVYLFPVNEFNDGSKVQNIMLIALKSKQKPAFRNNDPELNKYLQHLWKTEIKKDVPILTDDYAPVDAYTMKIIKEL